MTETYTDVRGADGETGTLSFGGETLAAQRVSGVEGIPDGLYYVVENVSYGQTLTFEFLPASNREGSVSVEALVRHYEEEGWDGYETQTLTSSRTVTFDVLPVSDGVSIVTGADRGTEDVPLALDLRIEGFDSSEMPVALTIDGVPDGFLVLYGDNEGSATLAQNAGRSVTTTVQMVYGVDEEVPANLWNVPLDDDGTVPAYVAIKAPENWSGTVGGIVCSVVDAAGNETQREFSITMDPEADGLTLAPYRAHAEAYEWTPFHLTATMTDLDGSETMTLKISTQDGSEPLDGTAIFRLADGTALTARYEEGGYTIEEIPVEKINDVQMLYHDYDGSLEVSAHTVDRLSDGTQDASDPVTGDFALTLEPATVIDLSSESGDHTILPSEETLRIVGGSGEDTVIFLENDTIDLGALRNVDAIDLTAGDHTLEILTLEDVIALTDNDDDIHTLRIEGDGGDEVTLPDVADTGYTVTQSTEAGYDIYTYAGGDGDPTVVLKIDQEVHTGLV